ncbi:5'/3'-nucleotidase SurE [Paraburkholderia sp.]|uniref:5'/3'-nucleotidase SurE n=1 Tax=Paraburkholderia sp. TaxID=1926495 RepID=UPI0039E4BCCA
MVHTDFPVERVLLTNDDGIDAPGLRVLEEAAASIAREVWTVAPVEDQSGKSHSLSLYSPIRVDRRAERRYAVAGTPGDCVAVALGRIMKDCAPDFVLSGINCGANLGIETVFSGTVGAAMTSMLLAVPAIALSQDFVDRNKVPWARAAELAPEIIRRLVSLRYPEPVCLSVNFPSEAVAQVKALHAAHQGAGLLQGVEIISRSDPRDIEYHWLRLKHRPHGDAAEAESALLGAGHVTVTPLRFERTAPDVLEYLRRVIA